MSDVPGASPVSGAADAPVSSTSAAPSPSAESYTAATQVASVGDLREKAPKVYKSMVEGIAQTIITKMKRDADRLKEIAREGRRQAGIH